MGLLNSFRGSVMGGQLYLTQRVDDKLESVAKTKGVLKEALGNVLLMLSLCNDEQVNVAVNIIKAWNIKGETEMEKRGLSIF